MSHALRWIAIYIVLTILTTLAAVYLLEIDLPLNGIILYSAFPSLMLTILLGWIDVVFIKKDSRI